MTPGRQVFSSLISTDASSTVELLDDVDFTRDTPLAELTFLSTLHTMGALLVARMPTLVWPILDLFPLSFPVFKIDY